MPRTTNSQLLEKLFSLKVFPIYFYEIQVKDSGDCTVTDNGGGSYTITDSNKSWVSNEWAVASSIFTDYDGNEFAYTDLELTANGNTTISLESLTKIPVDGPYTITRWIYLSQLPEQAFGGSDSYEGTYPAGYQSIRYPSGGSVYYRPYPIKHGASSDHQLGEFPTITVDFINPGSEYFNFYSAFERYSGLRDCLLNIKMAFIEEDGTVLEGDGTTVTDQYIITQTSISNQQISFTVQSLGNFKDKKVPERVYSKLSCGFSYRDQYCKSQNMNTRPSASYVTTCNKLYKSNVYSNMQLIWQSGAPPSPEVFAVSGGSYLGGDVASGSLVGCLVEREGQKYFWEVTGNTSGTITVESHSGVQTLKQFVSGGDPINIIDKECCVGHCDTGNQPFVQVVSVSGSDYLLTYKQPNNLIFNGSFSIHDFSGWTITAYNGADYGIVSGGLMYVDGSAGYIFMRQEVANTDTKFETGRQIDFVMRYYGFDAEQDADSYIAWRLQAIAGANTYEWNATTKAWASGVTINQIDLRGYEYRTSISTQLLEYLKMDEFVERISTVFPNAHKGTLTKMELFLYIGNITWPASDHKSKVYFDVIGLYPFIQSQHYGGFPALQTSRYWRV